MIEIKTLKDYLRGYGIPYAYNKKFLYVPGTTLCGDQCFWQFAIEYNIITDCCILFEMPDTSVKKCYDDQKRFRYSRRLNESTLNKVIKLMHTSYNHTLDQIITVC